MIKVNKCGKRKIVDHTKVHRPIKVIIQQTEAERCIAFLKEYSQGSTIHGVQHIFREGETTIHRVIWSALFLLCFSGATYMTFNCWESYVNFPIAISVEETHHPLANVLFPAVSICPTNKILISRAISYLSSRVQLEILNDTQIFDFLTSLTLLQHPVYSQMTNYLQNSQELLPLLSNINISELMYKSMPTCEEIFFTCYWQGIRTTCCNDLFFFQKSEEGFCYSFNSLTSKKFEDCSYLDLKKPGCKIRSSSSVGPTTGLEIFFKVLDPNKYKAIELSGTPKLKVEIHNPTEYPEAGIGSMMPIGKLNKMSLAVKPIIITSTDGIRSLKQEDRGCIFKDEKIPLVSLTYSQKTCLIECRVNFMIKVCQCVPYYFYGGETYPACNSVQLYCILNISESLRFYKPPNSVDEGFQSDSKNILKCNHCLPTCNEVNYDVSTELSKDQFAKGEQLGYIDVFYKSSGAVKYKRDITYDFIKLIVDIGAIGGLFLGGSLLSILEIIYWLVKSLITIRWSLKLHNNIDQQVTKKKKKKKKTPALLLKDKTNIFQ